MTQPSKPRVVVWIPVDIYKDAVLPEIRQVPGVELVVIDGPDQLAAALDGATGLISAGASKYTREVAQIVASAGQSVRWFQTVAAGNDGFVLHGVAPDVVVTGSGGHSAPVVAEHAMALLLGLSHCLPDLTRLTAAGEWNKDFRPRYRSLFGKTVAVVGLGPIGLEIAKRARAFDMKVIGVSRSGSPHEGLQRTLPVARLHDALAEADATILAVPLTPETERMIGAAELAAMKPTAYLVNISRGRLVDQAALKAALASGRLAGAGLDVTDPEPLPAGDPLWSAPNLVISPHVAGAGSSESPRRLAAAVRANLELFLAGEPLRNVLPFGRHAG